MFIQYAYSSFTNIEVNNVHDTTNKKSCTGVSRNLHSRQKCARARVTHRGASYKFFVMVTCFYLMLRNTFTYIKGSSVGRLHYAYICKYSSFINIKVNSVHDTTYKNSAHVFHETVVVDTSVSRPKSPTGVRRANFCQGDMFYITLLSTVYMHKR